MRFRLALTTVAASAVLVAGHAAAAACPSVQIVSLTRVVGKGAPATLVARVAPTAVRCSLVIYLASGPSAADGIVPKRVVNGRVSWTWTVARRGGGGTHPVYVECGRAGIAKTSITYV